MSIETKGKELIVQLQRSEWLPTYNEDLVHQTIRQITAIRDKLEANVEIMGADLDDDPSLQCRVIFDHETILRNKRYLLAYLNYRIAKIKDIRWQVGTMLPPQCQKNLCAKEVDFFSGYDQLLTQYMDLYNLDLTADHLPPKDLYIEIRVMEECGEVLTENGPIHLSANTTHYLLRTDVEHLIRQGLVVQITHE